jgi:hypothetical protein
VLLAVPEPVTGLFLSPDSEKRFFYAFKQELLPYVRGHFMPFLHFLKFKQSQGTSYLGSNQVNKCRSILNTWRNSAARVGLDYLDSSAL